MMSKVICCCKFKFCILLQHFFCQILKCATQGKSFKKICGWSSNESLYQPANFKKKLLQYFILETFRLVTRALLCHLKY